MALRPATESAALRAAPRTPTAHQNHSEREGDLTMHQCWAPPQDGDFKISGAAQALLLF